MKKHHIKSIGFSLCLLGVGSVMPAQADNVNQSQMLANPCLSCHGPDQKAAGSIPALVGLKSTYIVDAMNAFKTDKRKGTVMNRIAKGYTDKEIRLLADYFQK